MAAALAAVSGGVLFVQGVVPLRKLRSSASVGMGGAVGEPACVRPVRRRRRGSRGPPRGWSAGG